MSKTAEVHKGTAERPAKTAAAASQAETLSNAMALPQELTRFYAMRMKQDFETIEALGRCRTPVDVVNVWTEAAQRAVHDYQESASRILDASISATTRAA